MGFYMVENPKNGGVLPGSPSFRICRNMSTCESQVGLTNPNHLSLLERLFGTSR